MSNPDIYPGAQYVPLADGEPPAITQKDIICLHTMAGYLDGTTSYFKQNGWSGTESHWGVGGGPWDGAEDDGRVVQYVPCDRKADANLDGNWHVLSIETSDGAKSGPPAWTDKQVEACAQIIAWACQKYNIPCEQIPDTKPGRRGIGYHRQGIDNWRVSGGEYWSSSTGKVCPGDQRVGQVNTVVNRAREIMNLPSMPPPVTPPGGGSSSGGGGSSSSSTTYSLSFEGGGSMSLRYLKAGLDGKDVKSLQQLLAAKGFNPGTVDGDFGPNTTSAVKAAQKALGTTQDAVVGPSTMEGLLEKL